MTIYSENEYQSYDLDFVSHGDFKRITQVMISLGFAREKGRHFIHPESQYYVEFPGTAATVGDEPIREFEEIKTKAGVLRLLTPTYCVMDRLSAFYHWKDEQSLEQAVLVATAKPIVLNRVRSWSERERMGDKFREFERRLANSKKSGQTLATSGGELKKASRKKIKSSPDVSAILRVDALKAHPWRACPRRGKKQSPSISLLSGSWLMETSAQQRSWIFSRIIGRASENAKSHSSLGPHLSVGECPGCGKRVASGSSDIQVPIRSSG